MNELFDDRLNALVHALAWSLLHFLWQGAALASAFGLALIATRRCSARTRYVIGCATLSMMALAPAATLAWLLNKPTASSPLPPSTLGVSAVSLDGAAISASGVNSTLLIIVMIWALGAAACTLWLFGGWVHARRLRRLPDCGLPARFQDVVDRISAAMRVGASVRLVESAAVAVPMTMGWLAPVILLPASLMTGLSAKQLEAIIAHEFAHIRRFDYLVNLLQVVIESLLFYHPAVWWVSRRIRLEREYCCDDLAVMVCGDRVLYARALTELEALRGVSGQVRLGLSSNGGSLMKRIVRLIDLHSSRRAVPARLPATLAAGALLASASAAFAFVSPQAVIAHGAATNVERPQILALDAEASAAFIESSLPQWEIHSSHTEADANRPVWVLAHAMAQEVEDVAATASLTLQAATLLDANSQDAGEMPSQELLELAQVAYPFNLFELMPWISPAAHRLIPPPGEESSLWAGLVQFSMPDDRQWVPVWRTAVSLHIELQADRSFTNLTLRPRVIEMRLPVNVEIKLPQFKTELSFEWLGVLDADEATVDDETVEDEAAEEPEEQDEP